MKTSNLCFVLPVATNSVNYCCPEEAAISGVGFLQLWREAMPERTIEITRLLCPASKQSAVSGIPFAS
jgi:hypothetical protein